MEMTLPAVLLLVGLGVLVGVMSAMFGVGGGVIMVPFIVLVFDKSQHLAEGTSLLVVVPTAIAGVIAHRKRGYVRFKEAAMIAVAGMVGGYFGARLALAIDPTRLQTIFGVFTVLVALRLLRDGYRTRASAP
jgi:uncharacterized membrane protein YfcA